MNSLRNSLAAIGVFSILGAFAYMGFKSEIAYREFITQKENLKREVSKNE